jgi:hypothetical protein
MRLTHESKGATAPSPCLRAPGLIVLLALALVGCAEGTTQGNTNTTNTNSNSNSNNPGGLPLGLNCSNSTECESNLCLVVGQELLCSKRCEGIPCPDGFYCAKVDVSNAPPGEPIPETGFYCLPDRGGLCKACGSDINCTFAGDRCLDLGGGQKVCGRDCQFDGTCPVGYNCQQGQCWPINNTCDCIPERVGATRPCQNMNSYGVCLGTQVCNASGWSDCDAPIPTFEVCNGEDDDCDGDLPSDELDNNNNGTIDCLDNCTPSTEVCDAQDNDCNGHVDDADPVVLCGAVAHGEPACLHGECVIGSCEPGYVDLDEDMSTGCECQLTTSGGLTCDVAEAVGPLSDAGAGQTETRTGILQELEVRWYSVQAVDSPDSGAGACDNFHFRVQLTQNPGSVYKFDVIETHCAGADACPNSIVDFQWFTNFRLGTGENAEGECACSDAPGENENECVDNSRVFLIRLFREAGTTLTCEPYEIEFSNGVYPSPI